MKGVEIALYLAYADQNVDLVVLTRETYERLMCKAKLLDSIRKVLSGANGGR